MSPPKPARHVTFSEEQARNMKPSSIAVTVLVGLLAGCGGGASSQLPPAPTPTPGETHVPPGFSIASLVASHASVGGCTVSFDGLLRYTLPVGDFAPIDVSYTSCQPSALSASNTPPIPTWAKPIGPTQTIFTAVSLQDAFSQSGFDAVANAYHQVGVPVTWMLGNRQYIDANGPLYDRYHSAYGDDIQAEPYTDIISLLTSKYPWYASNVSIEGAGHERNIAGVQQRGEHAFWGVTWNSFGTDLTYDRGAPWGSYCIDTTSYKRPSSDGSCDVLSMEWTARDLTRAYFSQREDAFSTDPEDIVLRGGFDVATGPVYARALVDAYAAAGESQPLLMVAQEESGEASSMAADAPILSALASEAVATRMRTTTLAQAAVALRAVSNRPRAVAFPFIPGGRPYLYRGSMIAPGTIDYHDSQAGMTFIAGHTTPSRVYPYALDPTSVFSQALVEYSGTTALTRFSYEAGSLYLHFTSSNAVRYGIALWGNPAQLGLDANAMLAGRAGAVVAFDLPAGESDQVVRCAACASASIPYSY